MNKDKRQEIILNILNNNNIKTQEELVYFLRKKNIEITQATLSRDLNELHVKKDRDTDGTLKYIVMRHILKDMPGLLIESVVSVDYAMNTVVIRCQTGMAQAVCAAFDKMDISGVVGTIAGDDTIFVLMKDEHLAAKLTEDMNIGIR